MIKALLFDLDGLLVNSEELYLIANKKYFKKFNFTFTEAFQRQGTGKKFADWIPTVIPPNGKSGEEMLKERNVFFFQLIKQKLSLLPGAGKLLIIAKQNFATALVTSSKVDYLQLVFEKIDIKKYFDIIISGEMVSKSKPDPEGYKKAAEQLKVVPEECIVLEDAPSGVLSGLNAQMRVIAVPSKFVEGDPTFAKADIVKGSLNEINLQLIKNIGN